MLKHDYYCRFPRKKIYGPKMSHHKLMGRRGFYKGELHLRILYQKVR
jgi:hypothetical protein